MECYTLFQLNQFIKRFVALNVPEALWITAELSQINYSKGHAYIELIQKSEEDGQIIAHSQAIIWARQLSSLQTSKKTDIKELLKEGLELKLKVDLDFHERFGMKLIIQDVDENYTVGKLAIQKAQILKRLKADKLLEKNKSVALVSPLRKIAILSSANAAGYQDFVHQLEDNEMGYAFKMLLFHTPMQGAGVEKGFLEAFEDISIYDDFDCVVIIRGGGSKIDLASFDNYEICKAVAECKFPVITGIGHDIDETLLDLCAHLPLKTPTAVADFILHLNLEYESAVMNAGIEIFQFAKEVLKRKDLQLNGFLSGLEVRATSLVKEKKQAVQVFESQLDELAKNSIKKASLELTNLEKNFDLLDVKNTLKRGFSITRKNGSSIKKSDALQEGDIIETEFLEGQVKSKILK